VLLHGSGAARRPAAREAVLQRRLCGWTGLFARQLQLRAARHDAKQLMDPGVQFATHEALRASKLMRAWKDGAWERERPTWNGDHEEDQECVD
jgi:hypothetical protein